MNAAGLGFGPRLTDSESVVLPLDDPALNVWGPRPQTLELRIMKYKPRMEKCFGV